MIGRQAKISQCTWDPLSRRWRIHGQLLLQYGEDDGDEYEFVLEDLGAGYRIIDEHSPFLPESERHWLKNWARERNTFPGDLRS